MKIPATVRILALTCVANAPLPAQLTLAQAVEGALHNYPAVRVSQEQINAAAAGIRLARTAYLPRVDAVAQVNRATRNNVFGLLLPTQGVIPSMSGPVIGSNNFGTAWGSAVGGLVTWEPFDFGLRSANVATAAAARAQTEAALKRTEFDVAVATADAYLTLAAAQETVRAAQAGVERGETILRTIQALVNAELRPGADRSRGGGGRAGHGSGARHGFAVRRHGAGPHRHFRAGIAAIAAGTERRAAGYRGTSHGAGADRHSRTGASPTPRAGAVILSAVLSARRGIRARQRRGNRRPIARWPERPRA